MCDKSDLTYKQLLEAILAKIFGEAKNPELFTRYGEWNNLTSDLNELVKEELNKENDADKRQVIVLKRDFMVRELIILMRNQFVHSYLFDDLWLQASQGCTILRDYAHLNPRPSKFGGHQCDGIKWTEIERSMMPDRPKRRFDFRGSERNGQPYYSCLDHAISNLICKVWGFSGFTDSKFSEPKKSMLPSIRFDTEWWKDASMYFAVLLCFGDSILDDHVFLDNISVTFNEPASSQDKLETVLSAKKAHDIREALWERIQELISDRG